MKKKSSEKNIKIEKVNDENELEKEIKSLQGKIKPIDDLEY